MKAFWSRIIAELHEQVPIAKRGWVAIVLASLFGVSTIFISQLSTQMATRFVGKPPEAASSQAPIAASQASPTRALRIVSMKMDEVNGFIQPTAPPPLLGAVAHFQPYGPDGPQSVNYIFDELSKKLKDSQCFRPDQTGKADEKGYLTKSGDWISTRGWRMPHVSIVVQNVSNDPALLAGFEVFNASLEVGLGEGGPDEVSITKQLIPSEAIKIDILKNGPVALKNEIIIQPKQFAKISVSLKATIGESADYLGLIYSEIAAFDGDGHKSAREPICVELPGIATGSFAP